MLKFRVVDEDRPNSQFPDPTDPRVVTWRNLDGSVCAHVHTENRQHWLSFPGVGKFLFNAVTRELFAFAEPDVPEEMVLDTYHRLVRPMGLQVLGTEVIHASAVLIKENVIALCAASGTGKSTTAFSLSRRGYTPWADDVVAFEFKDSLVNSIPLPFRIRLRSDAANFLDKERAHLYSKSQFHSFLTTNFHPVPLSAIFVLKRLSGSQGDAIYEPERLSPERAIRAVLSHAWCFSLADEERKKEMMVHYLDLVARVPVFEIPFRSGLQNLPDLVDRLEAAAHNILR